MQTVGGSLRTGAARYKHMASLAKDHFCGAYLEAFQAYHKAAAAQFGAMSNWYNEAHRILYGQQGDYRLEDLEGFLDKANGECCGL